jgi:ABC-type lipoprotein export system ATPase subunit
MASVLELRQLRKSYREADGGLLDVIHINQLSLAQGDQVALVGQSGSGKSTLLNLISGIQLPDSGEILVNDTDITKLPEAERDRFRAAKIGYVFQSFNLLQGFTALENVLQERGNDRIYDAAELRREHQVLCPRAVAVRLLLRPAARGQPYRAGQYG